MAEIHPSPDTLRKFTTSTINKLKAKKYIIQYTQHTGTESLKPEIGGGGREGERAVMRQHSCCEAIGVFNEFQGCAKTLPVIRSV